MNKWEKFYLGVVACLAILALAGCSVVKMVFDAAKDGVVR
jgi:predicted aminopeptidase